ncbi:MAG: hypothetical protein KIT48_04520 [Pseudolabrys sp.]|nr:hypothetical protein [Pseudolabrys sp.]
MDEFVAQLRRDLIASEFGERRCLARRQAEALATIHQARRAMARTMQIDPAERRERLRRIADAVQP